MIKDPQITPPKYWATCQSVWTNRLPSADAPRWWSSPPWHWTHWHTRSGQTPCSSQPLHTRPGRTVCPLSCGCLVWLKEKKDWEQTQGDLIKVPSTAMHSANTCPEVKARGFSRRPLQAGHQIWRANPILGALLPNGAWSIIHCESTLN